MQAGKYEKILKTINQNSFAFEHTLDPVYRKKTGSYYTSLELTFPMAKELIESLPEPKRSKLHKLRFLEPCVGTGNFVFAYILAASEYVRRADMKELIDNIYVCDINVEALAQYRRSLQQLAAAEFEITLDERYFAGHIGHGLLFDVTNERPSYIPVGDVFPGFGNVRFDIVMTNPPYKNLKAESGHYASEPEKNMDKDKYEHISKLAKSVLPLSSYGTLNLYKLFVEEIISRYTTDDALVSLLIPTSILTDKTCEKIRARIVRDHHLVSLKNIPENNRFIGAQQSLTVMLIDKANARAQKLTSICKSYMSGNDAPALVDIRDLATEANGYCILLLNQGEMDMLNAMSRFPRIKDLGFIVNLRGELDLTANKRSITGTATDYKLLRGRNIGYYELKNDNGAEYVETGFVKRSSKNAYIKSHRLVCQQISNIAKERRLSFARVDPGLVLANSCNFIAVTDNEYGIDIDYLAGLLNSKLYNWFFKVHSSNNHINNYEIDNFPVPTDRAVIKRVSSLVKTLHATGMNSAILDEIDNVVARSFGMNGAGAKRMSSSDNVGRFVSNALRDLKYIIPDIQLSDIESLLADQQTIEATVLKYNPSLSKFDRSVASGIIDKYKKLAADKVLNHTTFKLSDLDMEMITPIPQGGNWKHIPENTVNKSQRLKRITETGGRTTLYGRLHYQKPSYTITTYFNRPGNGTYVHPVHNRVLSVREAARFQAFADDYYFYGNKTQLLKQIGNAVPTLLAYQIGRKIVGRLGKAKSLDLFCGAGGLTSGLKSAGIDTVLCTDYDEAACTTIKINNPDAEVICGDITDETIRNAVTASALASNADIVCGGPPCQGFSMAGYRNKDDPRNQLFREFVAVVEKAKPKVVLFENVEGILTFGGGETYRAIHELFSELGYKTEGRLLKIDRFGVPQKRKRVIIMCTRNDIGIDPADLYPEEITADDATKITVADSIADLEQVECSDDASHMAAPVLSNYNKMLKGLITHHEFLEGLSLSNKAQEQLSLVPVELLSGTDQTVLDGAH